MSGREVLRFAPSPNGELHLGHALSALIGFDEARACGGRFLLRVEDIDTARTRAEFVSGIFADLSWLGVVWEEPVVFQSRRTQAYRRAAERLAAMGLLYPCFATRRMVEAAACGARDPDGAPLYVGLTEDPSADELARRQAEGEPFALRLRMGEAIALAAAKLAGRPLSFCELDEAGRAHEVLARPERWGDAIIVRKDLPASYHLAVVVDDAWQGVTRVSRGRDLYAATDMHRLLQVLLDLPAPLYRHHRLIIDAMGRKLAKSARSTSLSSLRAEGLTPIDIRRLIGLPEA
jgi:glutamyl-Q tRNA(Asp) synthetase